MHYKCLLLSRRLDDGNHVGNQVSTITPHASCGMAGDSKITASLKYIGSFVTACTQSHTLTASQTSALPVATLSPPCLHDCVVRQGQCCHPPPSTHTAAARRRCNAPHSMHVVSHPTCWLGNTALHQHCRGMSQPYTTEACSWDQKHGAFGHWQLKLFRNHPSTALLALSHFSTRRSRGQQEALSLFACGRNVSVLSQHAL